MHKYPFNTPSNYLLSTKPNFYKDCLLKQARISNKNS